MKWSLLFSFLLISYPIFTFGTFPVDEIVGPLKDFISDQLDDIINDVLGDGITEDVKHEVPYPCGFDICYHTITFQQTKKVSLTSMQSEITNVATKVSDDITRAVTDISDDITGAVSDISDDITGAVSDISGELTGLADDLANTHVPTITDKIAKIPYIAKIPSVSTTLDSVKTLADGIPGITELLKTWTTNPISLSSLDDFEGVEALANTLSNCMFRLLELGDLGKAIEDVIGIDIDDISEFMNSVPDPTDIVFRVIAKLLLPKKSLVVFLCDEGVRIIIELANKMLNGEFSPVKKRRMSSTNTAPTDNCHDLPADEFCEGEGSSYTYEDPANVYYIKTVNSLGAEHSVDPLIPDPYDNSNTDEYQKYKKINLIIYIINELSSNICDIIENILGKELLKNAFPGITCSAFKQALGYAQKLLGIAMGGADLHDGDITNVRLKAIFRDRITIIHNQFALRNMIETEFNKSTTNINNRFRIELDTLKQGILGIVNTIESEVNEQKITLKRIKKAIDNLNCNYPSSAKNEISMRVDGAIKNEEEGLIVFKIKLMDLYIFGAVFIGLIVIIMVIIQIVLMKCCNGYHSGQRFASVPKYDYNTSDTENIQ